MTFKRHWGFGLQRPGFPSLSAAAAVTLAYDALATNIVHHYEIARRGYTTYTGSLVRLRRDSDNAESDFGYDENNDLDTGAITTWLGGATGYVVTVYDQIGSDNPTQATTADQPLYVASGQNGKPTMRFDGANHYLQTAYTVGGALSQPFTVYAAAALETVSVNDGVANFFHDSDSSFLGVIGAHQTPTPDGWFLHAGTALYGGAANDNFNVWAVSFNSASSEIWINTSSNASGDTGAGNPSGISIGGQWNGAKHWDGDIAMIAIADPNHDATDRAAMETAINAHYSAY